MWLLEEGVRVTCSDRQIALSVAATLLATLTIVDPDWQLRFQVQFLFPR
jgi:hypothetical protein